MEQRVEIIHGLHAYGSAQDPFYFTNDMRLTTEWQKARYYAE